MSIDKVREYVSKYNQTNNPIKKLWYKIKIRKWVDRL